MRAGRLRHKVVIEQTTESQDTTGAVVNAWSTFAAIRASYEPLTGKESYTASQELAQVSTRFRMRYISGVTPKMRLVYEGRIFNIISAYDPYGKSRELHIMAVEDV